MPLRLIDVCAPLPSAEETVLGCVRLRLHQKPAATISQTMEKGDSIYRLLNPRRKRLADRKSRRSKLRSVFERELQLDSCLHSIAFALRFVRIQVSHDPITTTPSTLFIEDDDQLTAPLRLCIACMQPVRISSWIDACKSFSRQEALSPSCANDLA